MHGPPESKQRAKANKGGGHYEIGPVYFRGYVFGGHALLAMRTIQNRGVLSMVSLFLCPARSFIANEHFKSVGGAQQELHVNSETCKANRIENRLII